MALKLEIQVPVKARSYQSVVQKFAVATGLKLEHTRKARELFDYSATDYYINLIDSLVNEGKNDAAKRLLMAIIPNNIETFEYSDVEDGIGEENSVENHSILSHFFENRILIGISSRCPQYCRYCFRRRRLGKKSAKVTIDDINLAFDYIERSVNKNKLNDKIAIDEIILSGGEPLNIPLVQLEYLISRINKIDNIKTCRIDTKLLAVKPHVFTKRLLSLISSLKAPYVLNHFIHPEEITAEVATKVSSLLKSGIITGAHIPILHGINDDYRTIKELVNKLYFNKIRPYYLIQYIPTKWTEQFRVPLEKSIEIREKLVKECSGFSIPALIVYLPHGKGKAIINSKRDIRKIENGYVLFNVHNEEVLYEEKI
ncbi:MAG: radical SAM protein [Bacteroidales bacterium]